MWISGGLIPGGIPSWFPKGICIGILGGASRGIPGRIPKDILGVIYKKKLTKELTSDFFFSEESDKSISQKKTKKEFLEKQAKLIENAKGYTKVTFKKF